MEQRHDAKTNGGGPELDAVCALGVVNAKDRNSAQHNFQREQQAPGNCDLSKSAFEAFKKGGGAICIIIWIQQCFQTRIKSGLGSANRKNRQAAKNEEEIQNYQIAQKHQNLHRTGFVVKKIHGLTS